MGVDNGYHEQELGSKGDSLIHAVDDVNDLQVESGPGNKESIRPGEVHDPLMLQNLDKPVRSVSI